MTKLTLTNYVRGNTTLLENEFIDEYMPKANGEYVKVYLLLLRYMGDPSMELTVSGIADLLECTEKDVTRALNYWKKQGLVDYGQVTQELQDISKETGAETENHSDNGTCVRTDGSDSGIREGTLLSGNGNRGTAISDSGSAVGIAVSGNRNKKAVQIPPSQRNRKDFGEVIHVTEQYLGKTLTKTESEAIVYFYDDLEMSADLIEYLIEYCVENGHKSIHYIRKVALSWADEKIKTVEEAKMASSQYSKDSYIVLNAYGIKGRAPAASEMKYIRRWNEEYGFSSDLIVEACDRTMKMTHQPSFVYTETILKNWKDKGVKTLADVKALDLLRLQNSETKKTAVTGAARTVRNKFNNFEGRKYPDMDELTRKLIETQ